MQPMIPVPEYWHAVAQGIDSEDQKASLFIKHNLTIGTAREEILRDLLRKQTPEPFRVSTGFIHQLHPGLEYCSPQLDIVVYDPTVAHPDYRIGDLVVVGRLPAKGFVEVKTHLDGKELESVLDAWDGVEWLKLPGFAFAFDGVTFPTFVNHLAGAMKTRPWGVPEAIAVHRQNYLFVRSGYWLSPTSESWHRPAKYQLAVNFGPDAGVRGQASGNLLHFYLHRLRDFDIHLDLAGWFNSLPLPEGAKVQFDDQGEVTYGNIARRD